MHKAIGTLERQLLDRRAALLGFIRSKVGDDDLAEDILQESLLRALQSAPELEDEEKLVPWLYRIIRNAITDSYRRHAAAARRLEQLALEHPQEEPPAEDHAALCACFRAVLPTMKPEYAQLIEAMDLGSEGPEQVAERLDITRNNLKVRHHRARQQLRERLEETCRTCARHGCIDCTCQRPAHVH
jgi:RNA polymerase sigma-70 factor (ECF subfamily)